MMFWVLVAVVVCWVVSVVVAVSIGWVAYRVKYPMLKTAKKAKINTTIVMGLNSENRLPRGTVMRLIATPSIFLLIVERFPLLEDSAQNQLVKSFC